MKIKKELLNIKTSATLAINELSKKLEKEGKEVFKFGLGQSPFPIPDIIIKELKNNSHQKNYLNVSGLKKLCEEVAKYHTIKNKYSYSPENVIIGPGSKELIFQTQLVLDCDLILPSPSWVSYEPQAQILNKKIHWVICSSKNNWHLNAKQLESTCEKLKSVNKLLILNSPNNPSGTTHTNLKELAEIVKKYNVMVLADEIYAELDFSGKYKSITHFYPENTIISSGLSKWCGAGGWRIGNLIFPEKLSYIKDSIRTVASETFTSVSSPIQYAAIKAFTEDHSEFLNNSRVILKTIADYIYIELLSVGIKCQSAQGGFYLICDFSEVVTKTNEILDGPSLCKKILNEIGFAMLPGSDFGIDKEKLISRIAFVDFDGINALKIIKKNKKLDVNILCPKIVKGINNLKLWINKN